MDVKDSKSRLAKSLPQKTETKNTFLLLMTWALENLGSEFLHTVIF